MAKNKTTWTGASVDDYLASRANGQQGEDCQKLITLLGNVTRRPPEMWGPSIVGFGKCRYTTESGRTGEAPVTGFAIRGREIVVYIDAESEEQRVLLPKLGKHRMGKCCLYFKRVSDLDDTVLGKLVANSVAGVQGRYE